MTLIEILVAVGIIGMLMALAIPAAVRARHAARNAECKSHLRQLALGFRMYADVHKDRFPAGDKTAWYMEIAPHLQMDEDLLLCPADPQGSTLSYDWRDDALIVPQAALAGKKFDRVAKSDLVLVFDHASEWHGPGMINVAFVSGAADSITEQAFEENLIRSVETGEFFFLPGQ